MYNYVNYISAGMKVLYDKTSDYLLYYSGYNTNNNKNNNNSDLLQEYNSLLQTNLYENENISTRLCPKSSYYDTLSSILANPTHIVDNIYLGSAFNAASYNILNDLNIKVIINATSEISEYYPDEFIYLRYKLYDDNKNSIEQYLETAYKNIIYYQNNEEYKNKNILIHCFVGASRSATIVIYYLMKSKNYTFDEALNYVRQKRPIVNPTFRLTKDLAHSIMVNK